MAHKAAQGVFGSVPSWRNQAITSSTDVDRMAVAAHEVRSSPDSVKRATVAWALSLLTQGVVEEELGQSVG